MNFNRLYILYKLSGNKYNPDENITHVCSLSLVNSNFNLRFIINKVNNFNKTYISKNIHNKIEILKISRNKNNLYGSNINYLNNLYGTK